MDPNQETAGMGDVRARLSTLWLFAVLNYLYCDIVGLMDPELLRQYLTGNVGGLHLTQGFLLGASILVEIPIAMVLLSRVMKHRANRWANIIAGATMTVVQSSSLFVGSSLAIYYIFFSILEVACTSLVVWYALRWRSSVT